MRAYAATRCGSRLCSKRAFEESALLDGDVVLVSGSLRALITLILPKPLVQFEAFKRRFSPDAAALWVLDQVVGVVLIGVEAGL